MDEPLAAQTIISSMLTPAFLILGAANLANIALMRLARGVDRARKIMAIKARSAATQPYDAWLDRYRQRTRLTENAVLAFFSAVATLVLACLSLALDHYLGGGITWLPVGLTILGMLIVLAGAMLLALECRIARNQIHEEIASGAAME
jgi:hypothetical protein